ncbi:MAG: hypothetical protein M3Y82_06935 [Verrucomicrobiota bacterium]|nr:hypothetical protein [Verrucomicrobiota bacterium]
MSDLAPKAELLRSLARLVRGLSALFWGLPLTLLSSVQIARTDWFDFLNSFAMLPPIIANAILFYGLTQMAHFQKQERIWIKSLDRAQILAFVNLGLSPFLFWWHRMPFVSLYGMAIFLLAISSLLFLFSLNRVLQRLTAMLPDETLRHETKLFGGFNRCLLLTIPILLLIYFAILQIQHPPPFLMPLFHRMEPVLAVTGRIGIWVFTFLFLMPLAMTMTLIWKIKDAIFASVFDAER